MFVYSIIFIKEFGNWQNHTDHPEHQLVPIVSNKSWLFLTTYGVKLNNFEKSYRPTSLHF
jgi:hypothetical protein